MFVQILDDFLLDFINIDTWCSKGKESGIIRVIDLKSSNRALIKGIEGMTQDVSFAFIIAPVLLACIDSVGDVYVYTIEENKMLQTLICQLTLHIKQVTVMSEKCV